MKKFFSILIAVLMMLAIIPTEIFADVDVFGVKAESNGTEVLLSWESAGSAESYSVYYKKSSEKDYKLLGTFKSLKLKVKKLSDGVSYDFKVESTGGLRTEAVTLTPEIGKKKTAEKYPDKGQFESAKEAVINFGAGINIGNSFDSCGTWLPKAASVKQFEEAWGNPQITKAHIKAIKDAGFGAVRLPVTWNYVSDSKGNIRADWMDRVAEVVDWILDEDLYCIINVHHDTGTEGWIHASESSYSNGKDRFKKIWEQIAERFKDYGEKLLFECMNETLNDANDWNSSNPNDFKVIKKWQQIFVDVVRNSGGKNEQRNIVLNTYAASSNTNIINSFELPNNCITEHTVLQVHNYDPQGFTWKNVGYAPERSTWGTADDKAAMESFINTLSARAESLGVAAIVGEFSSDNKNNESERAKHAAYMYSTAHSKNIAVFWWDNGDDNGCRIFDRKTGKQTMPKIIEAIINAVK